jgi:type II secretory pathway predicted ATPase ExeA
MNIRKAERKQAKIRLALQGPSGSGKIYSSLLIAKSLVEDWSKIVIIDIENFSADLYAHLGSFNVVSITPPYSPEKYIEAITTCIEAGMEVIQFPSGSYITSLQAPIRARISINFCQGESTPSS